MVIQSLESSPKSLYFPVYFDKFLNILFILHGARKAGKPRIS